MTAFSAAPVAAFASLALTDRVGGSRSAGAEASCGSLSGATTRSPKISSGRRAVKPDGGASD
jgi:hypothetical protein